MTYFLLTFAVAMNLLIMWRLHKLENTMEKTFSELNESMEKAFKNSVKKRENYNIIAPSDNLYRKEPNMFKSTYIYIYKKPEMETVAMVALPERYDLDIRERAHIAFMKWCDIHTQDNVWYGYTIYEGTPNE
jgi:hypothetical protein